MDEMEKILPVKFLELVKIPEVVNSVLTGRFIWTTETPTLPAIWVSAPSITFVYGGGLTGGANKGSTTSFEPDFFTPGQPLFAVNTIHMAEEFNIVGGLNVGGVGFRNLIHELAHAFGLNHPDPVPTIPLRPDGDSKYDNMANNIMSYNYPTGSNLDSQTYMLHDTSDLQNYYGKNMNYNSGNTVYSYQDLKGKLMNIWDGGGINQFNMSNASESVYLDLRPGYFSQIGTVSPSFNRKNISISFGVDINHAIGSSHADYIQGNSNSNVLMGLAGDDLLIGGMSFSSAVPTSKDTLLGGDGNDTFIIQSSRIQDATVIDGGSGIDVLSIEIQDSVIDASKILENTSNIEVINLGKDMNSINLVFDHDTFARLATSAADNGGLTLIGGVFGRKGVPEGSPWLPNFLPVINHDISNYEDLNADGVRNAGDYYGSNLDFGPFKMNGAMIGPKTIAVDTESDSFSINNDINNDSFNYAGTGEFVNREIKIWEKTINSFGHLLGGIYKEDFQVAGDYTLVSHYFTLQKWAAKGEDFPDIWLQAGLSII